MNQTITARLIEVHKNKYLVKTEEKSYNAVLSGKLLYSEEYPIVGDFVDIVTMDETEALIIGIHERKSFIARPDRGGHADNYVKTMQEQAMIANVDYVFIVTSMNQNFNLNRIARYVAIAISGGCKPIAILTKADLCQNKEELIEKTKELNEKLDVYAVSSYTGEGIEELRSVIQPGDTIALMGSSGVGKSTLINTLAGEEIMKVSEIREDDDKGRHTTTHRQLIEMLGAYVIDTPGMRELGLCDAEEGINETFTDIVELMGMCKFRNCNHETEPGCAVLAALEAGSLSEERWKLYLGLTQENSWATGKKSAKMIGIAKKRRELKNSK